MIMALIALFKYDWSFGERADLLGPPMPNVVASSRDR
jgi:hypothetical protein